MQIYLGSDHGGYELKEKLKVYLAERHPDFQLEDCGAHQFDPADDYPPIALEVAEKVAAGENALGILLCRSGSGMVIAANKFKGIRAVELYDAKIAAHAKSHNQANVITFGGDHLSFQEMIKFFEIFLQTEIDQDARHERRLQQISTYETIIK